MVPLNVKVDVLSLDSVSDPDVPPSPMTPEKTPPASCLTVRGRVPNTMSPAPDKVEMVAPLVVVLISRRAPEEIEVALDEDIMPDSKRESVPELMVVVPVKELVVPVIMRFPGPVTIKDPLPLITPFNVTVSVGINMVQGRPDRTKLLRIERLAPISRVVPEDMVMAADPKLVALPISIVPEVRRVPPP